MHRCTRRSYKDDVVVLLELLYMLAVVVERSDKGFGVWGWKFEAKEK